MSFVYYLGTRPVLPYLPNQVPLDGEMNKVKTLDQTPDGGVDVQSPMAGRHCCTEHFPTKVEWAGPADPTSIGDFSPGAGGVLHVSKGARDFVEALEPAVHQFAPFEMMHTQNSIQGRYWWIIGNRLDSVDREHTNYVLLGERMWRTARNVAESFPDYLPSGADVGGPARMAFNREQIGPAQIWRDKFIDTGGPLLSQEFADALRRSTLTGYEIGELGALV